MLWRRPHRDFSSLIESCPRDGPNIDLQHRSQGIVSKSTEKTIRSAVVEAGLSELVNGPVVGKALGLEGKAGIIEERRRAGGRADVGRRSAGGWCQENKVH